MAYFETNHREMKDLVDYLLDSNNLSGAKIIDHSLRGQRLWTLVECDDGTRYIRLDLMSKYDGFCGYKPIDETAGPVHYDCPMRLLNKVTRPFSDFSQQWRTKVIKNNVIKKLDRMDFEDPQQKARHFETMLEHELERYERVVEKNTAEQELKASNKNRESHTRQKMK